MIFYTNGWIQQTVSTWKRLQHEWWECFLQWVKFIKFPPIRLAPNVYKSACYTSLIFSAQLQISVVSIDDDAYCGLLCVQWSYFPMQDIVLSNWSNWPQSVVPFQPIVSSQKTLFSNTQLRPAALIKLISKPQARLFVVLLVKVWLKLGQI